MAVIVNSLDNKGDERLLAHYFNEEATVENYVVITENRNSGTGTSSAGSSDHSSSSESSSERIEDLWTDFY